MLANPIDKDDLAPVAEMKEVFEKSVVSVREIPAGAAISRDMVAAKKPGTGIPARMLPEVLGRTARVDIAADTVLTEDLLA
jgi:sialic acid synthase SpsE